MIRCPSCGAGQLATRATCSKCQGSLTEIVVGYKDRLALALDREQLESDGWRLLDVKEDVDGAPFSARFRRSPQAEPKQGRQRREGQAQGEGPSRAWVLVGVLVLVLAVGAIVLIRLRDVKDSDDTATAAAASQPAVLGVEGAPGVAFTGTISDGTASRAITGGVPQSIDLEANVPYAIVVQKTGTDLALLRVTVTCANGTTFSSSTTQPSGVLALSAHCE